MLRVNQIAGFAKKRSGAIGKIAIALVAHTAKHAGSDPDTTSAINTTGASLLVVAVDCIFGGSTVSDSKGNTWVGLTGHTGLALPTCRFYYVKNPTVGTGHTFTATGGNMSFAVLAYSSTDTSANADGDTGGDANAATIQPGSITPGQDDSVVIAALGSLGTGHSIDSGFTIVEDIESAQGGIAIAYLIQTAAAAVNPQWTQGSGASGGLSTVLTSFKHS
jgi:hypothetical protein